jgi:hypothetical protein
MQPSKLPSGFRRSLQWIVFGLPLWDIAFCPNIQRGESRGYATGIIAIGDIAKGWIALAGLAIGDIAFGGGAIRIVAIGGGALGYYAVGGGAFGKYVISDTGENPEAIEFFRQ